MAQEGQGQSLTPVRPNLQNLRIHEKTYEGTDPGRINLYPGRPVFDTGDARESESGRSNLA
jgi:hypothetical protein